MGRLISDILRQKDGYGLLRISGGKGNENSWFIIDNDRAVYPMYGPFVDNAGQPGCSVIIEGVEYNDDDAHGVWSTVVEKEPARKAMDSVLAALRDYASYLNDDSDEYKAFKRAITVIEEDLNG